MPKDGTDERPERKKVLNAITALRARASDKRKAAQEIQLEGAGLDHAADLLEQLLDSAPAQRAYDTVPIAAVAEALSEAGAEAEAAAFAEEDRPLPPPMRMVRDMPAPAQPEGEKPKATARVLALLQGSDHALDFETIRTGLNMRFSTCRRAVDQCVEAGQVVRYGPARPRRQLLGRAKSAVRNSGGDRARPRTCSGPAPAGGRQGRAGAQGGRGAGPAHAAGPDRPRGAERCRRGRHGANGAARRDRPGAIAV